MRARASRQHPRRTCSTPLNNSQLTLSSSFLLASSSFASSFANHGRAYNSTWTNTWKAQLALLFHRSQTSSTTPSSSATVSTLLTPQQNNYSSRNYSNSFCRRLRVDYLCICVRIRRWFWHGHPQLLGLVEPRRTFNLMLCSLRQKRWRCTELYSYIFLLGGGHFQNIETMEGHPWQIRPAGRIKASSRHCLYRTLHIIDYINNLLAEVTKAHSNLQNNLHGGASTKWHIHTVESMRQIEERMHVYYHWLRVEIKDRRN